MATHAYNLKNFKQILSWYATLLKNRMLAQEDGLDEQSPFTPASWTVVVTSTDDFGYTTTYTYVVENPGATYGQSLLDAFKSTANSIEHALSTLFINHDDDKVMWHEDLNFNLINAYASASQSYQWYDQTTEEFVDMPEFWFTRGCWYDMLPMCTKGRYLLVWQDTIEGKVRNLISQCRRRFQKHTYTYTYTTESSDGTSSTSTYTEVYSKSGNSRGFILDFWDDNLAWLKNNLDPLLSPIWKMGWETSYPEQNSKSADLVYITQLMSDISKSTSATGGSSSITTSNSLSSNCGTYDAKAAKLTLGC